jgi:hypothetical protein
MELFHILRDKYKNKPFRKNKFFNLKIDKRDAESKFKKSLKKRISKAWKIKYFVLQK